MLLGNLQGTCTLNLKLTGNAAVSTVCLGAAKCAVGGGTTMSFRLTTTLDFVRTDK